MNHRRLFCTIAVLICCCLSAAEAATVKDTYPNLTDGPISWARLTDLPAGIVMQSGEIKLTQKDLDAEIAKAPAGVRMQMKRNLFFVLENEVTDLLLQFEAAAWAKQSGITQGTREDHVKAYISSLGSNVSVADDEIKAFYDQNKDALGSVTLDQAKDAIKDAILGQKREQLLSEHLAGMGGQYQIDVNKTWAAKQYSAAMDNPIDKARMSGKPTLADLGSDKCQPCQMMAPILESLKTEYAGKANIVVVNVDKDQVLAARYGTQTIPVQIFYDSQGKEVSRHVGYFSKEEITAELAKMGVK